MRRRDKPLDVHKKLQLLRTSVESGTVEFTALGAASAASKPQAFLPKKKLNIPICDVRIDADYDKNVKPSFKLPTSYVRYTPKVGDEADISTDYFLDRDDMLWISNNEKLTSDKEVQRYLTHDTFESIIDVLERCTGMNKELTSLPKASKAVVKTITIMPPLVINKILPEIYRYWSSKRERLHKPLVRKYWPVTPYSDTNPYNVFRPRDKERYRLRRQQKKNDLESFRRFQHLKAEFHRIRSLMQLVVEREKLKQAALEMQREIFEQSLVEIGGEESGIVRDKPYRYRLQYTNLSSSMSQVHQPLAEAPSTSLKKTKENNANLKLRLVLNRGVSEQVPSSSGVPRATSPEVNNPPDDKKKRQKGQVGRKRKVEVEVIPEPPELIPLVPVVVAATAAAAAPSEKRVETDELPEITEPEYTPTWPNFMNDLIGRDISVRPKTWSDYLDDLELDDTEEAMPLKYGTRGRIGRGGRLVMDRYPIYRRTPKTFEEVGFYSESITRSGSRYMDLEKEVTYLYPTSLALSDRSTRLKQKVKSGLEPLVMPLPLSDSLVDHTGPENDGSNALRYTLVPHSNLLYQGLGVMPETYSSSFGGNLGSKVKHRPCFPVESRAIPGALSTRELEIYNLSDSEDEKVEITKCHGGFTTEKSVPIKSNEHNKLKFVVRV